MGSRGVPRDPCASGARRRGAPRAPPADRSPVTASYRGCPHAPTDWTLRSTLGPGGVGALLAVVCEYDASSGIGHAREHNVTAAAALGAFLAGAARSRVWAATSWWSARPRTKGAGGKRSSSVAEVRSRASTWRRCSVGRARTSPRRTRLTDPHLEPAVLQLGQCVRRPSRRRRDDRPDRSPRRRPHPQGALSAPQPRHRHHPPASERSRRARRMGSTDNYTAHISTGTTAQFSTVTDTLDRPPDEPPHRQAPRKQRKHPCPRLTQIGASR